MDVLDQLEKFIERVGKVLDGTAAIFDWCRQHPGVLALLLACGVVYVCVRWFAFERPARFVDSFYQAVNDREFAAAWQLLDVEYRKRWNDVGTFRSGFSTTTNHSEIRCVSPTQSWKPLAILSCVLDHSAIVDAVFVATDRFTARDINQPAQQYDVLWLRIKNNTEFESLKAGNYMATEAAAEPSLELTRTFKKRFTLQKPSRLTFRIARIDSLEEGIRWSQ